MAEGGLPKDFLKLQIKSEDVSQSEDHSISFLLKFSNSKPKYTIQCDPDQTVLQAISSKTEIRGKIKGDEDNIVLAIGEEATSIIATHFPCSCLTDGELVTLTEEKEPVEKRDTQRFDYSASGDKYYSTVNIETEGGRDTKTKPLFINKAMKKKFKQLCVYGPEDMTLEDAVKRDGRFKELGNFTFQDVTKSEVFMLRSDCIKLHAGKTFRISMERNRANKADKSIVKDNSEAASTDNGETDDGGNAALSAAEVAAGQEALATPREICAEAAGGSEEELNDIRKLLRYHFPELKEQSLNTFLDGNLKEILLKVDFGKTQQTFSEVSRVEELAKLGKSVCKIITDHNDLGTGFVLFKRYIITNAHLFDKILHKNNVRGDIDVTAVFGFKKPNERTINFKVKNTFIDYDREIDYAILELVVREEDEGLVPPGLMNHCCPMPPSGEACLLGHPNGDVLRFDPTSIIEKEKRKEEVNKHLEHTFVSVRKFIESQGINKILSPSEPLYNKVASYHTYMYYGSSGSPVFGEHCKVFGVHSGGFVYGYGPKDESVIEFARPLLLILQTFVTNLRTANKTELLRAVEEELRDNPYCMEILTGEEPMDES